MNNHFYAMISRMKNIYRWGLMRNTKSENLSEHSLEVAFIAHALAIIKNERFGGNIDENKAAVAALFHDTSEILTGDLPTPIKYYNSDIKNTYKNIEAIAEDRLVSLLPEYMQGNISAIYESEDADIRAIVKAADKISAYIKCIEESNMGNREFLIAKETIKSVIDSIELPEVKVFMQDFIPSFGLSLDELKK